MDIGKGDFHPFMKILEYQTKNLDFFAIIEDFGVECEKIMVKAIF